MPTVPPEVAPGRRVEPALRPAADRVGRCRPDRLVESGGRFVERSGPWAGVRRPAPTPPIAGAPGSKHHAVVESHGIPSGAITTAANVPDVIALPEVVDAIPAVRPKRRGRRKRRPKRLYADRGYDSEPHRRRMRRRRITPVLARRRTAHGSGLGKHRWPVERFFAWLHGYRRLRRRTDWDARMHNAFLSSALSCSCFGVL